MTKIELARIIATRTRARIVEIERTRRGTAYRKFRGGSAMLGLSTAGGAIIMSTSQRVSRGFHWLALFLAAITLVIGGSISVFIAFNSPETSFGPGLVTLAVSLAVYGLVRAIGWVIGGFATS